MANRNALAEAYIPLLWRIARNFHGKLPHGSGQDVEDCVGYGFQGLIESIAKFDPSRGYQFATFAGVRIIGAMRDGLRREDWVPRLERTKAARGEVVPVHVQSFDFNNRIYETSSQEQWFEPPDHRPGPTARFDLRDTIHELFKGLTKAERLLMLLYHIEGVTMREIGVHLGLSESRVGKMHTGILKRMRQKRCPTRSPDKAEILRLRESGHTLRDISEIFGISHQRVHQIIARERKQLETVGATS